jgi:hypothetical protein
MFVEWLPVAATGFACSLFVVLFRVSLMADLIDVLPPELDPNRPAPSVVADDSLHLSGELKEEGVFASLISSFRDVFFPEKLPPLVLESKPIYVADPMATKMSKSSVAYSVAFYTLLILLSAEEGDDGPGRSTYTSSARSQDRADWRRRWSA